ncbi:MAG: DPP IV N-terminal domain-containing protein [Rikenellaceae bacterium]
MKRILLLLIVFLAPSIAWAQNTPVTESNYELPARFNPDKMAQMIHSTSVSPKFLKSGNEFWYSYKTTQGTKYYIVDMAKRTNTELFDNAEMAAQITEIVKDPCDAKHLPIKNIVFSEDGKRFIFEVTSTQDMTDEQAEAYEEHRQIKEGEKESKGDKKKGKQKLVVYMEYDRASGKVTELADYQKPHVNPRWASLSPDGQTVIFARNYDLYWMDRENFDKAIKNEKDSTIVEYQITNDGTRDFAWGGSAYSYASDDDPDEAGFRKGAQVTWSPDSKHFLISRSDDSQLKELWVINNTAKPRPVLETYKYEMPGEENDSETYVYLFDTDTKEYKQVDVSAFKNQRMDIYRQKRKLVDMPDVNPQTTPWLGDDNTFIMQRTSRDHKRIDICKVDITAEEPKAEVIVEERMNTSMETRKPELVNGGKNIVTWSQRSGWAHLYLYDLDGNLVNQITTGEIHCDEIECIDDAAKKIYFVGYGLNADENPYYAHLCSVSYDGSGLKSLTERDFDHQVVMTDDAKYFVDNYSRVDTTPVAELKSNLGVTTASLQTADLSSLFASGYKFPEIFTVKAADGVTDLYGVMYKPFNFDPKRLYPVIEYVYPGPQTEAVNSSFSTSFYRLERLAQFGFIVITVGNRGGSPNRSLWYHNYGYGNLRDYGLDDKVVAVNQLANRYNFIDRTKVGITGHSGGGFMSTAAILQFPDFFKVAVSCAGNHENNIYNSWWSEKHHGVKEVVNDEGEVSFDYSIDQNSTLAKNLKGKLLLVVGDIDNNVHPANTFTMAEALIKAGKRFDLMVLPGQRHAFGDMTEYYFWLMGDYFSEHLIGHSEKSVDIPQMHGATK